MLALPVATLALSSLVPPKGIPTVQLAAAQAIAKYELAWWRRNHPTADLAVTFSDAAVTPAQADAVRVRLGYKPGPAVLDAHVLTIVFDHAEPMGKTRLGAEAFVFFGSFPKGFHARYLIDSRPRLGPAVLTRTVIEKYEMAPPRTQTDVGPPPVA